MEEGREDSKIGCNCSGCGCLMSVVCIVLICYIAGCEWSRKCVHRCIRDITAAVSEGSGGR